MLNSSKQEPVTIKRRNTPWKQVQFSFLDKYSTNEQHRKKHLLLLLLLLFLLLLNTDLYSHDSHSKDSNTFNQMLLFPIPSLDYKQGWLQLNMSDASHLTSNRLSRILRILHVIL